MLIINHSANLSKSKHCCESLYKKKLKTLVEKKELIKN